MKSMIKRLLASLFVLIVLLLTENISAQTKSSQPGNSNGCPGEWIEDCNIKIKEHANTLLIIKTEVWPNPSGSYFILQLSGILGNNAQIKVMDAQGRVLFSSYGSASKLCRFGDGFVPGLYFVQVILNNKQIVLRVVKL
jgi:hypothetical protein